MKRIYKYEFKKGSVEMPIGAKILSIQDQDHRLHIFQDDRLDDRLHIWALVDTDAEYEFRYFTIVGTGHDFPEADDYTYINTIQDRSFVWHIFELINK